MVSFKAKFPVLQELFAKNHRGGDPLGPPSGARVNLTSSLFAVCVGVPAFLSVCSTICLSVHISLCLSVHPSVRSSALCR